MYELQLKAVLMKSTQLLLPVHIWLLQIHALLT